MSSIFISVSGLTSDASVDKNFKEPFNVFMPVFIPHATFRVDRLNFDGQEVKAESSYELLSPFLITNTRILVFDYNQT